MMNTSLRPNRLRRLGLLAAVALLAAACGGGALQSTGEDSAPDVGAGTLPLPVEFPAQPGAPAPPVVEDKDGGQLPGPTVDNVAGQGPLIVRTGQLNLEVAVLDEALAAADQAVVARGGYVAASHRLGDDENSSAMVTYRIPVEGWETTLAALREVGTKVLLEQTSSEEVTGLVVDLGARLTNLRATESALQAIMARATRIPDILEVQAQLTGVRGEIEQLTAQKQSLEERAAMATLTVGFSPVPAIAVTQVQKGWDPTGEIDRAAATLVGLGQGLANAAIWFVIVLVPLALVLGVTVGAAWLVLRRVRSRPAPPAPPSAVEMPSA